MEKMRARFNEAEEEVSRLGQMLQKERQEKTALQEKLVKAEAQAPKLAKGQPDPQTLQKTLVERTSELERVRKELSDTKRKSEKQAEQIAAFEKDEKSGDDKAQNKVLSKQLADMTKERDKALTQLETLQSAQEKLNARLTSLQQEKDQGKAATTELASLKSRLENVTAQLKTQEDENKKIKSDLSAMQNSAARREAKIAELQKQTDQAVKEAEKANAARVAAAAVPAPVPQQQQPVERITSVAAPMPTARTSAETKTAANAVKSAFGQQDLQAALQRAGLGAHSLSSSHGGQVMTWKTSAGLTGEADIQPSSAGSFGTLVEQHISAQRSKCNGDFAAMPSGQGTGRAQYELACVGSNGGFASSLLFIEKEGQFIAIAHNAAPENMNGAMDARDRVAASLQ